jgi:phage shock protein PspC (stress-responsive transcriptional regulator)
MKPLAIRVNIGFVSAVAEDQQRTAVTSQGGPPEPELPERMWRRRSGRVVAGVCGGLADHLGVRVLWVRVAIAVMAGFGGAGVAAYAMLWVFVPQESPAAEHRQTRRERQQAVALIALGIALAAAFGMISGTASGWVVVPIGIALLGVAVVWREADSDQRKRWARARRCSAPAAGAGSSGSRQACC